MNLYQKNQAAAYSSGLIILSVIPYLTGDQLNAVWLYTSSSLSPFFL